MWRWREEAWRPLDKTHDNQMDSPVPHPSKGVGGWGWRWSERRKGRFEWVGVGVGVVGMGGGIVREMDGGEVYVGAYKGDDFTM